MIKFILALFFVNSAFALDAVVTVLETPMLKYKSYDAPVVQYLRKGDVIKVHPSLANDPRMNQYAPSAKKYAQIKKKMQKTPEWNQDPLFRGEKENTHSLDDEFIPTVDRQGHVVYVISSHFYVYFKDRRELEQTISKHDPTDYRLEEPLPKNYPLSVTSGYRGQFILGITQPYFESYPYLENATTKGYMSPVDANITMMRIAKGNYFERLFIGGTLNVRAFENSYTFTDRFSIERGLKAGLGPTISYDAFKGEKNRVNLSGTVMVYFFNQLNITQTSSTVSESRVYRGYSLAPKLNLQYHRKNVIPEIDFVLGTSLEIETATTFNAKNGAGQAGWWQELGADKFTTRPIFTLGGYIGIQSAY